MVKILYKAGNAGALDDILTEVSKHLFEFVGGEYQMSALAIEYRDSKLKLWSAAGPPAMLLRGDGKLETFGMLSGLIGSPEFSLGYKEININPGDRLFLYTDGISEMETSDGRLYGEGATVRLFKNLAGIADPRSVINNMVDALAKARGASPILDDMTMVIVDF